MSVKIEAHLRDGKKVSLTHLPSGTSITTAAPIDNNGDGSSFSPTDLVAGALASCALTIIAIVAEKNQYLVTGSFASVEKFMNSTPRRIAQLPIEIHLPRALDDSARTRLEGAAKACPVHQSLLAEIEVIWTFTYDC